jgi:hypothetical protein
MMRQVDKNKAAPAYQHALTAMRDQTGYQPGATPSMVAQRGLTMPTDRSSNFTALLNEFMSTFSSVKPDQTSKRTYSKMLPNHDVLIQIEAPDHTSAIEFSRILCSALDEELKAFAYPHTDGSKVEVECRIAGPALECLQTVEQLSHSLADTFKTATKKIGGINISTQCVMNKKSSYQEISLRTADTNYRKFLLKFI